MQFTHISMENDIMKESLICGANLDGKYGFPMLNPFNITPDKTVDFHRSKKLIDVKKLKIGAVLIAPMHIFDRFFKRFFYIPSQCSYSVIQNIIRDS